MKKTWVFIMVLFILLAIMTAGVYAEELIIENKILPKAGLKLITEGVELISSEKPSEGDMVESPVISIAEADLNKDNYTAEIFATWKGNDGTKWKAGDIPSYTVRLNCKTGYIFKSKSSELTKEKVSVTVGRVGFFKFPKTDDGIVEFTITYPEIVEKSDQAPLIIANKPAQDKIVYGDNTITLTTTGGSASAQVTWSVTSTEEYASLTADGQLSPIKSDGSDLAIITVKASMAGNSEYNVVNSEEYTISIEQRPLSIESVNICKVYDQTVDFGIDNIKNIIFTNFKGEAPSIVAISGGTYNSATVNDASSISGIIEIVLDNSNYTLNINELNNQTATIERAKLTLEPILILARDAKEMKNLNIIDFIKVNGFLGDDSMIDYFNIDIKDVKNTQSGIRIGWYKSDGTLLDNFPNKNGQYIYKISAENKNLGNYILENYQEKDGLLTISGIISINDEKEGQKEMPLEKQHKFNSDFLNILREKSLDLLKGENMLIQKILKLFFHPFF